MALEKTRTGDKIVNNQITVIYTKTHDARLPEATLR
jgi:hypothetical protein